MKKQLLLVCSAVLCLALACGGGGGGQGQPGVHSFALTTCDKDEECDKDFFCSPVYCEAKCIPDGSGKCLPCNGGKLGQCMPKPIHSCEEMTCSPGDKCEVICTGYCDASGQCHDVSCDGKCIPKPQTCEKDEDCGSGKHCEFMCPKGCPDLAFGRASGYGAEKCPDVECTGLCVDNPPEPKKCSTDSDCPDGYYCEEVYCTMVCVPDGHGGCLPCNDGYPGVCVPKPEEGCKTDGDCKEGEFCHVMCLGLCEAFAPESDPSALCKSKCFGQCLPRNTCANVDCGPGYECIEVCADCAEPVFAGAEGSGDMAQCGKCLPQCVPVKPKPGPCNEDADCPQGYHCEPVFCTMVCVPDGKGGCLPCNGGFLGQCVPNPQEGCKTDADCKAGERCQVYCMGLCDPHFGCGDVCKGVCVPQEGCSSDEDCGEGFHCEWVCTPSCEEAWLPKASGPSGSAPCGEGQCFGQCVPNPKPQEPCDKDSDCPPGFICEPVFCAEADYCLPDPSGGCVPPPCNGGHLGVCVPAPEEGCKSDADCAPGERCQVYCTGLCDPTTGCGDVCFGECVPAGCGEGCPEGYECVTVCPDCPGGADCGPCTEECVPVTPPPDKCNSDSDCPEGFHCEPVFCTMVCIPDGKGGCLPCNDGFVGVCEPNAQEGCKSDTDCGEGEYCEVFCTGYCPPGTYCKNTCFGVCVKKQAGCQSDEDCPDGFYCQLTCPKDCGPVPFGVEAPKCIGEECVGQCVQKPVECKSDKDCPEGYVCRDQEYCPPCVYSEQACLMPCETMKVCVPKPSEGCKQDSDCPKGEVCHIYCMGLCLGPKCPDTPPCVGVCEKVAR